MHRQDSRLIKKSPFHSSKMPQIKNRSRSPLSKSPTNRSFSNQSTSSFATNSEHLWGSLDETQIFPQFCLQLLKNEDKYVRRFKQTIESEKKKINLEMDTFISQIMHSLEDYRLCLLGSVDQIYKLYLQKYSQFRSDLVQINRIKQQITLEVCPRNIKGNHDKRKSNISNEHTINSIETSHEEFKKFHIMKYVSDLQKEKLLPVKQIGEELLILSQYDNGFLQGQEFKKCTSPCIQHTRYFCHDLIKNKYEYFRDPDYLFMKQKNKKQEKTILSEQQNSYYKNNEQNQPTFQKQRPNDNFKNRSDFTLYEKRQVQNDRIKSHPSNVQQKYEYSENTSRNPFIYNTQKYQISDHNNSIYSDRQNSNNNELKLVLTKTFSSISEQIILCSLPIHENLIAVGCKDGSLIFYDQKGKVVKNTMEHRSSLCTLSLINDNSLLASGSDHPYPQIFIWDINTLEVKAKFKEHKAAVTAIQCLKDGVHMISGSYDKKICIYNFWQKNLKYTLPTNKSSVTAIVINSDGSKMISCGLDNTINVWQIVKKQNYVETMFLQQIIENNAMVCSITNSNINKNIIYIGTKDGKVKTIDIERGQSIQSINCCNNAVIELSLVENVGTRHPFILAWPCKERCIKIVNPQNGKITTAPSKGYLEFSCGVGPKASQFNGNNCLCVLSQGQDRQISLYNFHKK